jgi:signal recognition particle subunit SRP19
MRKRKGLIFYPSYFEKGYSRGEGRKVPANLAAENVNIEILEAAAETTGFEYNVEPGKRYSRKWAEKRGYVVLSNPEGHKKKRLLLMLAKGVRRAAAQRESARQEAQRKKGKKKKKVRK